MSEDILKRQIKKEPLSLILTHYIPLKKNKDEVKANCPFCKGEMSINDTKGMYWCFPCQSGGDAINFVMKLKNLKYSDALIDISKKINLEHYKTEDKSCERTIGQVMTIEQLTSAFKTQALLLENIQKEIAELKAIVSSSKQTPEKKLKAHQIILATAEYYKTDVTLIKSKSREEIPAHARHVAMYILYEYENFTYKEIASIFNRDHSTVVSYCEKIKSAHKTYQNIRTDVETILSKIGFAII